MKKFIKMLMADKILMGLTAALLLITGVSGSLIIVSGSELFGSKTITALDFSSLTEAEITEWYESNFSTLNGLNFYQVYDEDIAEGKVISQEPQAGEIVTLDTGLTITLSLGQDPDAEFELPDFVGEGYTLEMIEEWFSANGFTNVSYEYVTDSEVEAYTVVSVNKSGTVKRSDEILVSISIGDDLEEVEVPDFTSMTVSEIKSWASANLISVEFSYVFSSTYDQGTIISQSVDAGETVSTGTSITIKVSNGKGITIEDITGYTLAQAQTYAKNNGLSLSIKYSYSSSVDEGLVISTSPSKGSMVSSGSTLTIYVSLGTDTSSTKVTIEDYAGKSESALLSYLKNLGVSYSKQTSYYSDEYASGLVVYNTTGEISLSDTVEYAVSLGSYVIDVSDFEGVKLSAAKSIVDAANNLNAGITLTYNIIETSAYTTGTLYGCAVSSDSKTITCNLAAGSSSSTAYIYNQPSYYTGNSSSLSVESTTATVQYALGAFKNLTIKTQSSTLTAGAIISISVNGSTVFESGQYDTSTTVVVVTISSGSN